MIFTSIYFLNPSQLKESWWGKSRSCEKRLLLKYKVNYGFKPLMKNISIMGGGWGNMGDFISGKLSLWSVKSLGQKCRTKSLLALIREGSLRGLAGTQISRVDCKVCLKNLHIFQLLYAIMKPFSSYHSPSGFPRAPKDPKESYRRPQRTSKSI
jgi:hypothetical protein